MTFIRRNRNTSMFNVCISLLPCRCVILDICLAGGVKKNNNRKLQCNLIKNLKLYFWKQPYYRIYINFFQLTARAHPTIKSIDSTYMFTLSPLYRCVWQAVIILSEIALRKTLDIWKFDYKWFHKSKTKSEHVHLKILWSLTTGLVDISRPSLEVK